MHQELRKFDPNMLYLLAEHKGMNSTDELAEFLDIPAGTVQDWLDGLAVPNNMEALHLVARFDLPLKWFAVPPERMASAA